MKPFNLSVRLFSKIFWEAMLQDSSQRTDQQKELIRQIGRLDELRASADYNTGSINAAAAWCLYSVVRYFRPSRALEVGTFIGKSTWSIATAMDHEKAHGAEIHTCDMSNSIDLPYQGQTKIFQYKKTPSTEMLRQLSGSFDFAHFDGRVSEDDAPALKKLLHEDALIALDDFEGTEKGVANLMNLQMAGMFQRHLLVYPCEQALLKQLGFSDYSVTAILLPMSLIRLTKQG